MIGPSNLLQNPEATTMFRLAHPSVRRYALPAVLALLFVSALGIRAADTLPARIADDAF